MLEAGFGGDRCFRKKSEYVEFSNVSLRTIDMFSRSINSSGLLKRRLLCSSSLVSETKTKKTQISMADEATGGATLLWHGDLWTESKRPRTLEAIEPRPGLNSAGDNFQSVHAILSHLLHNPPAIPPLAFQGPPGSGKTTAAMAFARALCRAPDATARAEDGLEDRIMRINGSEERRSQTLAFLVGEFVRRAPVRDAGARRVIFVDEADGMPQHAQDLLLIYMEEAHRLGTSCFILAFNDAGRMSERLMSRCFVVNFAKVGAPRSAAILKSMISGDVAHRFNDGIIRRIVERGGGDMRTCINLAFLVAYGTGTDTMTGPESKLGTVGGQGEGESEDKSCWSIVDALADVADREATKRAFATLVRDPLCDDNIEAWVSTLVGAFERTRDYEQILAWLEEDMCDGGGALAHSTAGTRIACLNAVAESGMRIASGSAVTTLQVQGLGFRIAKCIFSKTAATTTRGTNDCARIDTGGTTDTSTGGAGAPPEKVDEPQKAPVGRRGRFRLRGVSSGVPVFVFEEERR